MKRTTKINGMVLRYALAEWQCNVASDAAEAKAEATGKPHTWEQVADEFALRFFHSDLVADHVLASINTTGWERVLQSHLDSGQFDALQLRAIIEEAMRVAVSDHVKRGARSKNAAARLWVEVKWIERTAEQFKTRDKFADWCIKTCPHTIKVTHERVRDDWTPRGVAPGAGRGSPRIGPEVLPARKK